ncbi:MAG TPA: HAD family hydrolase, partial [Candidatus Kapabacteria bacterium]|nr:HAD family hydrolase [Candidatus Kapabacteria bacterium]
MKNKAFFLDRDGIINERLIGDYVKSAEEFKFIE